MIRAIFTSDAPQFHGRSATVDGLKLIKAEFSVGHGVCLSMDTPSPDSAPDLMIWVMQGCEVWSDGHHHLGWHSFALPLNHWMECIDNLIAASTERTAEILTEAGIVRLTSSTNLGY